MEFRRFRTFNLKSDFPAISAVSGRPSVPDDSNTALDGGRGRRESWGKIDGLVARENRVDGSCRRARFAGRCGFRIGAETFRGQLGWGKK